MHVREVNGRSLRFGHRGWLWNNAFLLYDKETDSIWHHLTGWAMSGPLRGASLPRFPTVQTTFAAWRAEYPATLVLPKPAGDERPLDRDVYAGRNSGLAFGLGVDLPQAFRLYPFEALAAAGGVVTETVGEMALVVALDPVARSAFAYESRTDGDDLDLVLVANAEQGPVLRERDGRRAWRLRSGRPAPGSGAGTRLRPLLASPWETFAWRRQHPAGTVWPASAEGSGVPAEGR